MLIRDTGRRGHCDISLYDSGDLLSCKISLRNAMLEGTGREYFKGLEWPMRQFEDIYAFNRDSSMRGFSLIFRGSLGCSLWQ